MAEILEQSDSDTAGRPLLGLRSLWAAAWVATERVEARHLLFPCSWRQRLCHSLNSRFIHDPSVAHSIEIRRRVIPLKSDLGTRDGAVMHHQINQAIGRQLRQLRSLPEYKAFPLLDF